MNSPLRILLVDDNASVRRVFKRAFEQRGFVVETASSSATAATAAAAAAGFDVLVTDFDLVEEDGNDVIRAIAKIDARIAGHVVILTARSFEPDHVRAEALAGRYIVSKDEPAKDLEALIVSCATKNCG